MAIGPAHASDGIGSTVGLTPAATGSEAGRLDLGSAVYRDETVKTGPSGVLELKFIDQTHLALGASSAVKLDKFVYGGGQSDTIVLGLTKGAFRFATGVASKKSYRIQTPLAAIGVRGTRFSAMVGNGVLRVTLEEGGLDVCPSATRCTSLNRPNETVEVYRDGTMRRVKTPFNPTIACSQSAGSALCVPYGSDKVGPVDPANGSKADTSLGLSQPRQPAAGGNPGGGGCGPNHGHGHGNKSHGTRGHGGRGHGNKS